ncbi:hypothetical protein [Rhodoglobus sp.]
MVLTLLGSIMVLLRLAAVSRGDLDLAFALVHVSNFGEILLSTGLLMAPALALFGMLAVEVHTIKVISASLQSPNRRNLYRGLLWFVGFSFALFIAAIFQSPFGTVVLLIAMLTVGLLSFAVIGFGPRLSGWGRKVLKDARNGRLKTLGLSGLILIAVVGASWILLGSHSILRLLIPSDQAWAHSEVVSFSDRDPYVARVLSSDSEWTYLVIDDPRALEIVPSSVITARSVCSLDASVDAISDRLWSANSFGSVALSVSFCIDELELRKGLFAEGHD